MNILLRNLKNIFILSHLFLISTLSCASMLSKNNQSNPVVVNITFIQDSVSLIPQIEFTIINTSTKEQQICMFHTPFEGIKADIFEIKDSLGNRFPYKGVMVKRAKPEKNNFIIVKPGESKSVIISLSPSYILERETLYTIKFIGNKYMNNLDDSNLVEFSLK